ncbi:restriction endonuclease subunit S [Flavobacterium pectinovorum]|uniref:Type I restriction enzyme, S subunit n=1 Tax=Flavobacterium pectinovorum TaxID=29533 RepID=A0ABY1IZK1_9FLAO|nr:restriction endonuclease subunit S [Flavobacterium pectinovorum]SHL56623.1 type I restriction enzyme, S subunit [Flavobacterium pectinovorum]
MSTATLDIEKRKLFVPKLRFQEFDKDWRLRSLGEITNWASGGTPPKDNPLFWNGDISWISASSMRGIIYSDSELKITDAGLKKGSKLAKKGSLLILVRGSMLFNKIPIGIVAKDVAFNQDVKSIVVDNNSTSEFILNWFTAFESKILNMVTGTGIGAGKLDLQDLKTLKILLPTLPEQQKIASFLIAVDEKIRQLSRKKELLEQYKKGVMQQLFSGKLRFKDENGEDYPDWEEKKLGSISNIKKGKQLNKIELTKVGLYPCINGGILPSGYTDNFNTLENTITISEGGNSCGFINFFKCKFWSGGHNYSIEIINLNKTDNNFIFQLLKYNQSEIMSLRVGSGLPNIQKKDLNAFLLKMTSSIKEQQKIANFLSSIDIKIESTNKQIIKIQTFKKGLLQQMFI